MVLVEKPVFHPKIIREFFFWAGIIATIAYRIIVVLNHYSKTGALIAWYIGTIGFVLYFYHRYQISEKRAKLIAERQLEEKVSKLSELNDDEKAVMSYIFTTLKSSKERWNYICIFIFSGLALLLGIYLDFIQPLL